VSPFALRKGAFFRGAKDDKLEFAEPTGNCVVYTG
jgi:hypothetical protein